MRRNLLILSILSLLIFPAGAGAKTTGPRVQSGRFSIATMGSYYQMNSSIVWSSDLVRVNWIWQKATCNLYPWCTQLGTSKPVQLKGASATAYAPLKSDWGKSWKGTVIRGCVQAVGKAGTNTLCTGWRGALTNIPFSSNYNFGVQVSLAGGQMTANSTVNWFEGINPTLLYTWQRSLAGKKSGWKNIPGARSQTYALGRADQGHYLRACVRAANPVGLSMDIVCGPDSLRG